MVSVHVLGAAATLAATLLGGGGALVPILLAVRETGYVLATLLFLAGACWTLYTSWLLLRLSELSKGDSYESIALLTLGKGMSVTVQVVIILNAFLLCVSVQDLFVDLLGLSVSRSLMVIISGVVVLPITAFLRRVDRLAPLSFITALTAIIMLGFVLARCFILDDGESFPASGLSAGPSGDTPAIIWLEALATIVIGYVVQFNVLPVFFSLPAASAKADMMSALYLGMGLACVMYVSTLLLSYLTFGILDYDSILAAYTAMPAGMFATVQLGIGQLLSYPIIAHAAVTEVGKYLLPFASHAFGPPSSSSGKNEKTLLVEQPASLPSRAESAAEGVAGVLWVVLSTALALAITDVSSLLSVVGAVCATPLMTVFPPLMLLHCTGAESEPFRPVHAFMCGLGVLATLAGTVVALVDYGS